MPSLLNKGTSASGSQSSSRSKPEWRSKKSPESKSKSSKNIQSKCRCCSTILHHPSDVLRFKCAICQVTIEMMDRDITGTRDVNELKSVTLLELQRNVRACHSNAKISDPSSREKRLKSFQPVSDYLSTAFSSVPILQKSFQSEKKHELIDYQELSQFYKLIMKLPSRKPLRKLLTVCNELLKAPHAPLEEFRWLLIIWFNPSVRQSLTIRGKSDLRSAQIRSLSYEVAKRCIGYLSNITAGAGVNKFIHYMKYMSYEVFQEHVETVNLYITLQMSRILERDDTISRGCCLNYSLIKRNECCGPTKRNTWELCSSVVVPPRDTAFKLHDYDRDWHIRSASKLMMLYHAANCKRNNLERDSRLATSVFYNLMFDFIDFKQDFNNWRQSGNGLMRQITWFESRVATFSLCEYPFLLSLGIKKAIVELEARQIMENEAENAFLSSLDGGKIVTVYLKIRVRRDHIEKDSLQSIQINHGNLLKSLKVEFINEPGIDAGGIRKEWFSLLTRSILSPKKGLFVYVEESGFLWFDAERREDKRYYLLGIVMGLAVFQSIILDIRFPSCLYKKLCGQRLTVTDYMELYPETSRNLIKILEYQKEDFTDVFGLTFEVTLKSGKTVELCTNGKNKHVTLNNKEEFFGLWVNFYMDIAINAQFSQLSAGFYQVFSRCQSIKLFDHGELELLLCGSREIGCYDFEMLRSVTRYTGGFADNSKVIKWFWDILKDWDIPLKRRLLFFVTGSDRVPPTGIYAMPFKISKMGNGDSDYLPVAHTCFSELCLCEYASKTKLEKKLKWAVTQSEGFGLI